MTMFSPEWRSPVCERPKATIALRLSYNSKVFLRLRRSRTWSKAGNIGKGERWTDSLCNVIWVVRITVPYF